MAMTITLHWGDLYEFIFKFVCVHVCCVCVCSCLTFISICTILRENGNSSLQISCQGEPWHANWGKCCWISLFYCFIEASLGGTMINSKTFYFTWTKYKCWNTEHFSQPHEWTCAYYSVCRCFPSLVLTLVHPLIFLPTFDDCFTSLFSNGFHNRLSNFFPQASDDMIVSLIGVVIQDRGEMLECWHTFFLFSVCIL